MTPPDAASRVARILADLLQLDVKPGQELERVAIESWDSLVQVRLVLALEEEFDVRFTVDEVAAFTSTSSILRAVESKG